MDRNELVQIARVCFSDVEQSEEHAWQVTNAGLEKFAQRIQPQWLPIESAPKGDIILLLAGDWFGVGFWQDPYWLSGVSNSIRGTAYCNFTVAFSVEPTHWMPLPKPPEGN